MFAKIKNNEVVQFPYGIDELKKDNPHTKYDNAIDIPSIFETTEAATVHGQQLVGVAVAEVPNFNDKTQRIEISDTPVIQDGVWSLNWNVIDLTEEEQSQHLNNKSYAVRTQRNSMLRESDWTQGKDIPENISSIWATYRQQLRDITLQEDFPWSVSWPNEVN